MSASSPQERQTGGKSEPIFSYTAEELDQMEGKTDWKRLEAMSDEEIDYSDLPPLTEEDFKNMIPISGLKDLEHLLQLDEAGILEKMHTCRTVSLSIPEGVIEFFKQRAEATGSGYQNMITELLKTYVTLKLVRSQSTKS